MRVLGNPILIRAMAVLLCATFAFLFGLMAVRQLRHKIAEEGDTSAGPSRSLETLPLELYNTVIQQLKQQKHELIMQSQAEQQRARTSENLSQAVLANLSSGVLVFGSNGLVKSANPAAKRILGFASATGMSAENIFRGAVARSARPVMAGDLPGNEFPVAVALAEEVHAVLREGGKQRQAEAEYETPAHDKRFISIRVFPVLETDGNLLGVACLINDHSELEKIRQERGLHGELSGEMALQLRTSLRTISDYCQQLAANRDLGLADQLARDIAQEAAQLERSLGAFLTSERLGPPAAKGAAGN